MSPPTQPSFFDPVEGKRLREDGIARAEDHAVPDWNVEVDKAILRIARRRPLFTTDDVWAEIAPIPTLTHEPRAMGAAMRRAQRAGWCKPTDEHWLTKRALAHRRPLRVWQSLLAGAR